MIIGRKNQAHGNLNDTHLSDRKQAVAIILREEHGVDVEHLYLGRQIPVKQDKKRMSDYDIVNFKHTPLKCTFQNLYGFSKSHRAALLETPSWNLWTPLEETSESHKKYLNLIFRPDFLAVEFSQVRDYRLQVEVEIARERFLTQIFKTNEGLKIAQLPTKDPKDK